MSETYTPWAIAAGENLNDLTPGTGHLYKAIAGDDRKVAANGKEAIGLLVYGGKSGEHVTLGIVGIMKFVPGSGGAAAGARLSVTTSGYLKSANSGDHIVGRCLENAVASGAIGYGLFNFAAPHVITTSEDSAG